MIGVILNKEEPCCEHVVKVCPRKHYYGASVVKYTCPVCDEIGNGHQLLQGQDRCNICGVNLVWVNAKYNCESCHFNASECAEHGVCQAEAMDAAYEIMKG